jgi:outer membrane immunogenic protein
MKIKAVALVAFALLAISGSAAFAQGIANAGAGSGDGASWVAGIHAGHNWQDGAAVYGIESDIQGTALKTSFNTLLSGAGNVLTNTTSDINYYGTVRGRLGWAAGQWLFYGTGGLAYGAWDLASGYVSPFSSTLGMNGLNIGWVGGGGIEYKWSPNVIFSLNYQYVDLGRNSFFQANPTISGSQHAQLQAVTFGVSWLFTPDGKGPHGIWEGNYIGAQAGGDWGNQTNASFLRTFVP